MPRPRRFAGTLILRSEENSVDPFTTIEPESGSSRPLTLRSSVVLPQPDGPSSVKKSPSFTCSVTLSTALTRPNCWARVGSYVLISAWMSSMAIPSVAVCRGSRCAAPAARLRLGLLARRCEHVGEQLLVPSDVRDQLVVVDVVDLRPRVGRHADLGVLERRRPLRRRPLPLLVVDHQVLGQQQCCCGMCCTRSDSGATELRDDRTDLRTPRDFAAVLQRLEHTVVVVVRRDLELARGDQLGHRGVT